MDKDISKRDWETISAYLDGQLSTKELARFESLLSQEPMLRAALDGLYEARIILQSTPRLRSPRNFFLTHEMVGRPRRLPRLAPAFGWASAVASLLFVFVLFGGLINTGSAIPVAVVEIPKPAILSQETSAQSAATRSAESEALNVTVAGGYSESDESENAEDESVMKFAAAPENEAAPKEPASDVVSAAEDQSIPEEEPTVQADVVAAEAPLDETFSTESELITDTAQSSQSEELLAASVALSPTLTETFPVQEGGHHIEKTATKEMAAAGSEVVVTQVLPTAQPTAEYTPLIEQLESFASEGEIGDDVMVNVAETPTETDWGAAIPENQIQPQVSDDRTSDILMGLEVFLVLLALGTGIAWIYLRRRGG